MHLEVDRQLPDGILPPWLAPVKDIYDGALKERLGIVYVAVDVLCGMVAQNSVRDGVNDRAHLLILNSDGDTHHSSWTNRTNFVTQIMHSGTTKRR